MTGPCGAPVAAPRKWSGACPLELDVAAHATGIDNFAEQNGSTIAKLRYEPSELMAGIGHGKRLAPRRHAIARQELHPFG